ncbi:MAG: hypothetical protein NZ898_01160 [Myxococcota bacterium]|nr:hypothetical protein [Myxococcota bacterium]MDW8360796.1 hypothetical protein [Myxococcales bacterium]
MFQDLLRDVVERTEGCTGALVMGFDGIVVDQYTRPDAGVDVETVGMEYSVILKDIRRAAEQLQAGATREVAVQSESMTVVVRLLDADYFLAATLRPGGNAGKARWVLRVKAPDVLAQLA